MAAVNVPVISEAEYPLFRRIGVKSQFPINYSSYLERTSQESKEFTNRGISTVEVDVDFVSFKNWFGSGKYVTYSDLLRYAASISKLD